MKTVIDYLLKVLNEELNFMDSIIELLKQKEKALIKNDVEQLESVVSREREYFISMRDMEESRKSIIELLLSKKGIDKKNITLGELAEYVDKEDKFRITDIRKKMRQKVLIINKLNKRCAVLLRKSIELADFSIRLLTGVYNEKPVYGKDGKKVENKTGKKLVVDYKV